MAPPLVVGGNRADAVGDFGRFGRGLPLFKEAGEAVQIDQPFSG